MLIGKQLQSRRKACDNTQSGDLGRSSVDKVRAQLAKGLGSIPETQKSGSGRTLGGGGRITRRVTLESKVAGRVSLSLKSRKLSSQKRCSVSSNLCLPT